MDLVAQHASYAERQICGYKHLGIAGVSGVICFQQQLVWRYKVLPRTYVEGWSFQSLSSHILITGALHLLKLPLKGLGNNKELVFGSSIS